MSKTLPPPERHLTWRVPATMEGELHLIVPHGDSHSYDFPIDFLFSTEEEALKALDLFDLREEAEEEGWLLCEETVTPIRRMSLLEEEKC